MTNLKENEDASNAQYSGNLKRPISDFSPVS